MPKESSRKKSFLEDALMSWILVTLEGLTFPGLANSQRCINSSPENVECNFQMKTNQSRFHTPITSFIRLSHSQAVSTFPHYPRSRYKINRDSSYAPESTEIIQASQYYNSLACSSIVSHGNHDKGSYSQLLLLSLPHDRPWCFPVCPTRIWPASFSWGH